MPLPSVLFGVFSSDDRRTTADCSRSAGGSLGDCGRRSDRGRRREEAVLMGVQCASSLDWYSCESSIMGASDIEPPSIAFITVGGRRWRTSDPSIPQQFRQELVNELMAARRAIRDAKNPGALRSGRRRVHDAKVALGERGHGWWLPPRVVATSRRIDATLQALLRSRGPGRSICPSDVARIVGGTTWRKLLPLVRERAVKMAEGGHLEILRRGRAVTRIRPRECCVTGSRGRTRTC